MKNLSFAFIMLSFFLFSCGGSSDQTTGDGDEAVTTEQSDETIGDGDLTIKDCDDFLDKYDQWTDDYLKVMKAFKEDPTNVEITQEYSLLSESMGTWATDWTNYLECAASKKYQKRWEDISDKLEKGLNELGFGD